MLVEEIRKKVLRILVFIVTMGSTSFLQGTDSLWFVTDGQNVVQSFLIEASLGHCFCPFSQYGNYLLWSPSWQFPGNYGSISFMAKATNDIRVGVTVINPWNVMLTNNFYSKLTGSSHMYDIVIGGSGNESTIIKNGKDGTVLASAAGGIPIKPHTGVPVGQFVQYKIVFFKSPTNGNDVIDVYYLNPLPVHNKKWTRLIRYQHSHPFLIKGKNRWVSFTNLDNPVFYTNIEVSSSTTLPPH